VNGPLVHADETQVTVEGRIGYVWAFTSLDEVAYVYSETRDATTPQEILNGFQGILVSDFYAAYDSIDCLQQKCLVHLMRDINEDLLRHPFDEEMQDLACRFGSLLRTIIDTIDRFGLKAYHLRKHKTAATRFFHHVSKCHFHSEAAIGCQKRLEKCSDKLFTFLDDDGVPWNNNNAEHAIKTVAELRNVIGGNSSTKGIKDYLLLLSICETCKYKGLSFLDFLRSGVTDVDAFAACPGRTKVRSRTQAVIRRVESKREANYMP
jgi:hypothetical protein